MIETIQRFPIDFPSVSGAEMSFPTDAALNSFFGDAVKLASATALHSSLNLSTPFESVLSDICM